MHIYLIITFAIYFGFLLTCIWGWQKFRNQKFTEAINSIGLVSVVIAVRNEENKMDTLLETLKNQDFPPSRFEIIFIDDHSVDGTQNQIAEWLEANPGINAKCVQSVGKGKKSALTEGIQAARGEFILTTDADCVLPMNWISSMALSFKNDTTLVIGLVRILSGKSLFSEMQAIEFSSLIGSGIALQMINLPVMCNGASLAFRKKSFEDVNGYEGNLHIPSGDDEFLMRKLKDRFPGTIQSVQFASVVTTRPQPSLNDFINQRLRWAGKWKANTSRFAQLLALFILLVQVSTVLLGIFLFIDKNLATYGFLLGSKVFLEGYFLFLVNRSMDQPFSLPAFFLLQIIYPFYVVVIGLLSQVKNYSWKGRTLSRG